MFVKDTAQRAENMPLGNWVMKNGLPAVAEPKIDGRRVFAFCTRDFRVLATKHNGTYGSEQYPDMVNELAILTQAYKKVVLDCELVPAKCELWVFDILHLGEAETMSLTYRQRRRELKALFGGGLKHVKLVPSQNVDTFEDIEKYKEDMIDSGYEGIVVKNPKAAYGQSDAWLKAKKFDTADVFVTGEEPGHVDGKAFYIATYRGKFVLPLGKVGSFSKGIDLSKITEGSVLEVQYQEVSSGLKLRHPFVTRVREDKRPEECSYDEIKKE